VEFPHPCVYIDVNIDPGGTFEVPAESTERAVFSVDQPIELDGVLYQESELLVLAPGYAAQLKAPQGARVLMFGGEPLDGPRYLWWNFVASDPERLESAKRDWVEGRFGSVPGETEWIPLPEH
jgi:redox-sensitive bicupin YhaK (pirin superfamily)